MGLTAACSLPVDRDQARTCRLALPAIEAGGARIDVQQVLHGREPNSVRIEYRATRPDGATQLRHATCRFAAVPPAAGRPDLVGITTDRGTVSPASIYLLKRYYLETPDSLREDPGPGEQARPGQ